LLIFQLQLTLILAQDYPRIQNTFFPFDSLQYYNMSGGQPLDDQSELHWLFPGNTAVKEYSLEQYSTLDATLPVENFQFSDTLEDSTADWKTQESLNVNKVDWLPVTQVGSSVNLSRDVHIWDFSHVVINSGSSNTTEAVIQPSQAPLVDLDPSLIVTDATLRPITTKICNTNLLIESPSYAAPFDTPQEPIRIQVTSSRQESRIAKRRREKGSPLPGQMCFTLSSGPPGLTIQERAPNSESVRKKRHVVRNLGACLRCRWMKKPVSFCLM
jgi:hypothetical protein